MGTTEHDFGSAAYFETFLRDFLAYLFAILVSFVFMLMIWWPIFSENALTLQVKFLDDMLMKAFIVALLVCVFFEVKKNVWPHYEEIWGRFTFIISLIFGLYLLSIILWYMLLGGFDGNVDLFDFGLALSTLLIFILYLRIAGCLFEGLSEGCFIKEDLFYLVDRSIFSVILFTGGVSIFFIIRKLLYGFEFTVLNDLSQFKYLVPILAVILFGVYTLVEVWKLSKCAKRENYDHERLCVLLSFGHRVFIVMIIVLLNLIVIVLLGGIYDLVFTFVLFFGILFSWIFSRFHQDKIQFGEREGSGSGGDCSSNKSNQDSTERSGPENECLSNLKKDIGYFLFLVSVVLLPSPIFVIMGESKFAFDEHVNRGEKVVIAIARFCDIIKPSLNFGEPRRSAQEEIAAIISETILLSKAGILPPLPFGYEKIEIRKLPFSIDNVHQAKEVIKRGKYDLLFWGYGNFVDVLNISMMGYEVRKTDLRDSGEARKYREGYNFIIFGERCEKGAEKILRMSSIGLDIAAEVVGFLNGTFAVASQVRPIFYLTLIFRKVSDLNNTKQIEQFFRLQADDIRNWISSFKGDMQDVTSRVHNFGPSNSNLLLCLKSIISILKKFTLSVAVTQQLSPKETIRISKWWGSGLTVIDSLEDKIFIARLFLKQFRLIEALERLKNIEAELKNLKSKFENIENDTALYNYRPLEFDCYMLLGETYHHLKIYKDYGGDSTLNLARDTVSLAKVKDYYEKALRIRPYSVGAFASRIYVSSLDSIWRGSKPAGSKGTGSRAIDSAAAGVFHSIDSLLAIRGLNPEERSFLYFVKAEIHKKICREYLLKLIQGRAQKEDVLWQFRRAEENYKNSLKENSDFTYAKLMYAELLCDIMRFLDESDIQSSSATKREIREIINSIPAFKLQKKERQNLIYQIRNNIISECL